VVADNSSMENSSAAVAQTDRRLPVLNVKPSPVTLDERRSGKHLIFRLASSSFCIRVANVQEILKIMEITFVPQISPSVKGVINLRGRVIPVVDLRIRLGFPKQAYGEQTCIIVLRTQSSGPDMLTGVIVDEVSEVISIAVEDIQDPPDFGNVLAPVFLVGMARLNERVGILLDVEKVLSHDAIGSRTL
jgi:purine-binding chemotaxis protein CheW